MRKVFVTLVFGLGLLHLTAQTTQTEKKSILVGKVISDTYPLSINNQQAFLTTILDSENKIEIRFTTYPSFESKSALVLSFNENWTAKLYYFERNNPKVLSREINGNIKLDSVFSRLVDNNIFSLPNQNKLTLEKCFYDPTTNEISSSQMVVGDGSSYVIDFKVGKLARRYSFSNPDSYANYFPFIHELRCYANIVDIFNELTTGKRKKENK